MTLSTNLGRYSDVLRVFDAVLQKGPATLTFQSEGKAHYWRMRAYHYRKLLHEKQSIGEVKINFSSTPYDDIVIRQVPGNPLQMRVELNNLDAQIEFDGGDTELPEAPTEVQSTPLPEDEFESAAFDLVQELTRKQK